MATYGGASASATMSPMGDQVRLTPEGFAPIDGVVDYVSPRVPRRSLERRDLPLHLRFRWIRRWSGTTFRRGCRSSGGRGRVADVAGAAVRPPPATARRRTRPDAVARRAMASKHRRPTRPPTERGSRALMKPHAPPDWEQRFRQDGSAGLRDRRRADPDVRHGRRHPRVHDPDEGVGPVRTVRARDGQVRQLCAPRDPTLGRLVRQVHGRRVPGLLDRADRSAGRRLRGAIRADGAATSRTRRTLLTDLFHRRVLEDFRSNSRNLSRRRRPVDGPGRRARATWSRSPTS